MNGTWFGGVWKGGSFSGTRAPTIVICDSFGNITIEGETKTIPEWDAWFQSDEEDFTRQYFITSWIRKNSSLCILTNSNLFHLIEVEYRVAKLRHELTCKK